MSIKKNKRGSWEVRFRTPEGKHHQKSFTLKADAERYEREFKLKKEKGTWVDPTLGKMTLAELFDLYRIAKSHLRPKSLADIDSVWNHHLKKKWGKHRISDINITEVHKWMHEATLGQNKYTSTGRVIRAQALMCRLLDYAVDIGYLSKNLLRKSNGKLNKMSLPKTDKTRPVFALTPTELLLVAKAAGKYETFLLVAGMCGLRWAELVGLQVQDVSDDSSSITVTRSLSEVNGKFTATQTKNGQTRTVPVPPSLREKLRMFTIGKGKDDLVFTNSVGNPISAGNFNQRVLKTAIKVSGVPRVTMHDFRHTCASIAISSGANVLAVANVLGHSDPSITLKRYGHLYKEDRDALALSIDRQFI